MGWDAERDIHTLGGYLRDFDWTSATAFCERLIARLYASPTPYPDDGAGKLLGLLRRKRRFAAMQRLAEVLIETGSASARVRRLYAQALLDQDHITAALLVLERLVADTEVTDPAENAEARGLVGRAYKQLYVNADTPGVPRNRQWLASSAGAYLGTYQRLPELHAWHGINVVAVADRARRDGVPLPAPGHALAKTLAAEILTRMERSIAARSATIWDHATAAEACLALGGSKDALERVRQYVADAQADAFEFASTLRQFEEVWQLPRGGDEHEKATLALLRATVLRCEGGAVEQTTEELRGELRELGDEHLEALFGTALPRTLHWYRTGLERCTAVARIGAPADPARGVGTGILVRGTQLHDSLGDGPYLLTNNHVVGKEPHMPQTALRPEYVHVTFEGLPGAAQQRWRVAPEPVFMSPPDRLDATLLRLDSPVPGVHDYEIAPAPPALAGRPRVYVIGHPHGGTMSFSLQDNLLLGCDDTHLHYRAPTQPGSSGSPVFDEHWQLVALHHAGNVTVAGPPDGPGPSQANEGVNIRAIVDAVREQAGGA